MHKVKFYIIYGYHYDDNTCEEVYRTLITVDTEIYDEFQIYTEFLFDPNLDYDSFDFITEYEDGTRFIDYECNVYRR